MAGKDNVVDDRTPSVEDRFEDMRRQSALLFLALDAFADADPISVADYGERSRDGFRGFAEIAQALHNDILAVAAALQSDEPKPPTEHGSPFVWPAPEVE